MWRVIIMKHKVNIRIIDKNTGRENKLFTNKFMKAIDTYEIIPLPGNFKISVR